LFERALINILIAVEAWHLQMQCLLAWQYKLHNTHNDMRFVHTFFSFASRLAQICTNSTVNIYAYKQLQDSRQYLLQLSQTPGSSREARFTEKRTSIEVLLPHRSNR
jgi:hypothetical protein